MVNLVEQKTRILIVEDDENIRESIKNILEQRGYKTDAVETGAEAEKMTKKRVYNLALLDIKLPDTEGTQLLTKFMRLAQKAERDTGQLLMIMLGPYPDLSLILNLRVHSIPSFTNLLIAKVTTSSGKP